MHKASKKLLESELQRMNMGRQPPRVIHMAPQASFVAPNEGVLFEGSREKTVSVVSVETIFRERKDSYFG